MMPSSLCALVLLVWLAACGSSAPSRGPATNNDGSTTSRDGGGRAADGGATSAPELDATTPDAAEGADEDAARSDAAPAADVADARVADARTGERDAAAAQPEPDASAVARDGAAEALDGSVARGASFVYVGGWDWSGAPYPFRTYALDRDDGSLTQLGDPANLGRNPSYIAASAAGRFLYVANEHAAGAGVTVAAVDPTTGALRVLEREPLADEGTVVYTSLAPSGAHVLAANINEGIAYVFGVASDGTLSGLVDRAAFDDGAETHAFRVHPSGKWAYAPNKGRDEIALFAFDAQTGELDPIGSGALRDQADGPRHIDFTPDGRYAYVTFEANSMLGAYRVEADGSLAQLEKVSTLPDGFAGAANNAAHVRVHPSGRFVYTSNRGHDSIAVFAVADDGTVRLVEHASSRGETPRHFDIDEAGELLVVANQGAGAADGSICVFAIAEDGKLALLSERGGLPSPTAVAIVTPTR